MEIKFEPLSLDHVIPLLEFERENQHYFEQFITPRPREFYSAQGVRSHIRTACQRAANMQSMSFLATSEGRVIARANLKHIQQNQAAEIGYRVAKQAAGHGVASACVAFLVSTACSAEIAKLNAVVMSNNPASERVLVKNGFTLRFCIPNDFTHQGIKWHGLNFELMLDNSHRRNRVSNNVEACA